MLLLLHGATVVLMSGWVLGVAQAGGCPHSASRRMGEWAPLKVGLSQLVEEDEFAAVAHQFEEELSESGVVVVELGPDFEVARRSALEAFSRCVVTGGNADQVLETTLADGTLRRSLASSMSPGSPVPTLEHGGAGSACDALDEVAPRFRKAVHEATTAFAARLSNVHNLGTSSGPVLRGGSPAVDDYGSIADVFERGDHLEHMHSYAKPACPSSAAPTLDYHTDQGLFIAFTPAVAMNTVGAGEDGPRARFTVELRDGRRTELEFEDMEGALVFVLGDGVDQFVNPLINEGRRALRAAPHALEMAVGVERAWYGLMVLAPAEAVEPQSGLTYGDLRSLGGETEGLGCSRVTQRARELAPQVCAENELFCWFRCMDLVDHDGTAVSEDGCKADGFKFLNCTDAFGQPNNGEFHGDYAPRCTDYTHFTESPTIAPAVDCEGEYEAWETAAPSTFGTVDLAYEGRSWEIGVIDPVPVGKLSWDVDDDHRITMHHVYSIGRIGWMAVGLKSDYAEASHPGMNGAPIVMSIQGPLPEDMSPVNEYMIAKDSSAFREWSTPTNTSDLADATLFTGPNECFAVSTFSLTTLGGFDIGLDACHEFIWAASRDTQYASDVEFRRGGYHEFRGYISVNFSDPQGQCVSPAPPPSEEDDEPDPTGPATSNKKKSSSSKDSTTGVIVGAVLGGIAAFVLVIAALFYLNKNAASKGMLTMKPAKADDLDKLEKSTLVQEPKAESKAASI